MAPKGIDKIDKAIEWFDEHALIIVLVVGGAIFLLKRIPPLLAGLMFFAVIATGFLYLVNKKREELEEKEKILIK